MSRPAQVLLLLTRKDLLGAAEHLDLKISDRGRKDALVAALLEARPARDVVAALADDRVRALAEALELPAEGDVGGLRERIVAHAEDGTSGPGNDSPPRPAASNDDAGSAEVIAARLEWKTGCDSPNGRRVLDVRPGSKTLLSASADPEAAVNVIADTIPDVASLDTALPPEARDTDVHWLFTADELVQIAGGFQPTAMEDKWRVITRVVPGGLRVCFLRSWTNALVVVLEIRGDTATRVRAQSHGPIAAGLTRALLDGYLLGRPCVVPAAPDLGTDKYRLMTFGIAVAGRRCDFVEPATSRVWFPTDSDLGVPPEFTHPCCIERELPRELCDESMGHAGRYGLPHIVHAVLAMLEPSRKQAVESGLLPSSDAVMDHDGLSVLRRLLDSIAAMDEGQLRKISGTHGVDRNGLAEDDPTADAGALYGNVPPSRWIVWGRGDPRNARLRARPGADEQARLLTAVREEDPSFALGWTGWLVEIVASGAELLSLVHGEGTVRGWMHAGPVADASSGTLAETSSLPKGEADVTAHQPRGHEGRRRGALIGLAVGDALGAAVEFKPRGSFPPVTGYRSGGPHGLGPGEWTDDTSMALALADSLAFFGSDVADQARRYVAWWREGKYSVNGRCFDIGIATREALSRIAAGAVPYNNGDDADNKSGNGSIMRLAPVAIHYLALFPGNVDGLASHAASSSHPTHRSPKCLSACRYLAVVLAALMSGLDREEVLSPEWPVLAELHRREPLDPAIVAVARGSYRRKEPPQIRGSGYVVDSLEAALWAFHKAPTFRDAVLAAVNLGDDADTTGAVCGQLAGAYFGVDGIPIEWLEGLAKREWLEDAVRRLGHPAIFPTPSYEAASPSYTTMAARPVASVPPPHRLAEADATPPTTRCYWVVPGRLLAGAYPGNADPKAHLARVEKLWSAGVRTFVSLMEEHETNNAHEPFARYDDTVATLAARMGERGSCVRYPIKDVSIPSSPAVMASVLDLIDRELADGRPVYVHCFGGIGRTGTVIGCWLLRHGLASRDDVMRVLARLRQKDEQRASKRSPETDDQIHFMKTWDDESLAGKGPGSSAPRER